MAWLKSVLNVGKSYKSGPSSADASAPNADAFQFDQPEDLYARLGVKPTASPGEIRRAYRMRAKVFHPDVNPGNRASEDAFKLVSEAFEILSDVESRQSYDQSRQQGRSRSGPAMRNRRHTGQFARGFLLGMLTVFCLVPVILLVNAKRKEHFRTASATPSLTEGFAPREASRLRKDERSSLPDSEKGKEGADTRSTTSTLTTGSAKRDGALQSDARASHEKLDVQTDGESVETNQIGALSLKDVDVEINGDAAPAETDTNDRRNREEFHLNVVAPTTAKVDTSADASQLAHAVDRPERDHDRKAKSPTAELDGVELAHADTGAVDGDSSPPLTVRSGKLPVPAKARRPEPDASIEEHVRSVVTRQIEAFRRRDGRAAFAMASPAIQRKFRDAHKFMEMVTTSYPDIPGSKTASFLGLVRTGNGMVARFLLEESNGRRMEAHYHMVRHADGWRIDGCVIIPRT
jgi:curved DNA-binding protein CbpA